MAFMVVALHAGFLRDVSKLGEFLTGNGLFRIAVPIFFIINGFYFYSILTKNTQLSWFKRVAILHLVWMTLYSYYWFSIPEMSVIGIVKKTFDFIIGFGHLWYIPGLIGAAVVVSILHKMNTIFILACIGITFIAGVFIQYLGNYHIFSNPYLDKYLNYEYAHRNFLFLAFPFFSIGFLINKHSIQKVVSIRMSCFWSISGMLLLLLESYINFNQPLRDGGFDTFLALIIVCPAIFILFINLKMSGNSKNIALYSSAIYFVHIYILFMFREFTELDGTPLAIVLIISSIIVSSVIIKLNQTIKFLL
jgi:hypothetical protein